MTELPSGTVSLLFSDIEGSTALLSRLGPTYADALDGQRQVLREAWAAHGGTELGTEGDSFFVVFSTAESAVAAAAKAQYDLAVFDWPEGERVRVRMGIHTGTPTVHDGGYVGMDVHRAARIAGAAHGGQVVVSEATAKLVSGCLPERVGLRDLGGHHLKDIAFPERLFQLVIAGLCSDFAPLKTLGAAASLPRPPTPLVGRDGELAELSALLSSSQVRLLTLTGTGGSGKTRLAIALAQQLVERFPDGVYFVPLAAVVTTDAMWASIAEVLDVPPEGRTPPRLFAYVAQRSALFVLDNLEQIDGADDVVAELMRVASGVVVLTTSRRALSVPGEHVHPVPPLKLPDSGNLAQVGSSGAVQLFVQHAQMVRPSFALSDGNAADVSAICRRLDGLPLAIELAAARTRLLSPAALVARLDQALDIAAAGKQGPSRQKTLRDTIAWSYDLLDPTQQAFFCRLGAFSGGADLDAISAVTIDILDDADPFDVVAEVADASLAIVTEGTGGEPRISMLETVRDYALDQLSITGDLDSVHELHARHYLDRLQQLGPALGGDRYISARAQFEAENDNSRAALAWALPPNQAQTADQERARMGLSLCAALGPFWEAFGYFDRDGQRWLERAIERAPGSESLELAQCLRHLAVFLEQGQALDRAHEYAEASVAMCRRLHDSSSLAQSLCALAFLQSQRGDTSAARAAYHEALTISTGSGDKAQQLAVLADLSILEDVENHYETALGLKTQVLTIARETGDPSRVLLAQHNLACSLRLSGRIEDAQALMRSLIPDALELNIPANLMYLAEDYAAILAELGHHRAAVQLLAAADLMHEQSRIPRPAMQQAEIAEPIAKTRSALTSQQWNDAYASGHNMKIDEALAAALNASRTA